MANYNALPVQFLLSGTTFNGGTDANGNSFWINKEVGWSDSAPPRPNRIIRPWQHGTYRIPNYKNARIVSLSGFTASTSPQGRRTAEHQLAALCSDPNSLAILSCTEETGTLSAQVELDGPVLSNIMPGGLTLEFSIQLAAPDPRKYGTTVIQSTALASMSGGLDWSTGGGLDWTGISSGGLVWGAAGSNGSVQVNNTGTADIWPQFALSANGGTLVNPSITDVITGNVLALNWTLSGTDQIVITTNPIGRSVILNGTADRRSVMTSAQWFSLPANTSSMEQFQASSSTGAPTMSVTYAPGFW